MPAESKQGYSFLSIDVTGACQLNCGPEDVSNQGSRWMRTYLFPLRSNLIPYLLFLTANIFHNIETMPVEVLGLHGRAGSIMMLKCVSCSN